MWARSVEEKEAIWDRDLLTYQYPVVFSLFQLYWFGVPALLSSGLAHPVRHQIPVNFPVVERKLVPTASNQLPTAVPVEHGGLSENGPL